MLSPALLADFFRAHEGVSCAPNSTGGRTVELETFRHSLAGSAPPHGLDSALQALWWDAKGDWTRAHNCAQAQDDSIGAWVHAYLHRKEGDLANAGYWYRRAGKPVAQSSLDAEWTDIVGALIARG
jgi:hypothetical protein